MSDDVADMQNWSAAARRVSFVAATAHSPGAPRMNVHEHMTTQNHVGGAWTDAASQRPATSTDPATGEAIGESLV